VYGWVYGDWPRQTGNAPVYCAGGRGNEVALTFDDGPTSYTPRLLAALRRSPAPATFFLIGENAARYRAYARAEGAVGAVGEHTETHATLTALAIGAARREILQGRRSVERALGERVLLFRPPGDHRSAAIDRVVAGQGMLSVLYAVDPRDWARSDADSIAAAVASDPRLVAGAIVLLHEFHLPTVEAVPAIVRALRRRGLRMVSVPRLLADDPPTLSEEREDTRAGSCVHLYRRTRANTSGSRPRSSPRT
jgi:peptidoglycan/xylan/chitin deacetylase (PgdA/CDA1 family)